jgi:hypothetical protein
LDIPLNNFTVSANEASTIYFMMAPANLLGENLEVVLSYKGGVGIKYKIVGKNFVAGKIYAYTLSDGENLNLVVNAVDLGLPSGTLWADRNVGADSPEACGDYFAWGETESKSNYNWSTYKWCNGSSSTLTKYCTKISEGTKDNKEVLDFEDDAAYVNMGSEWRMPTHAELEELYDNCSRKYTTQNGVIGCKITGPNGNSIFLPAAGSRGYSGDAPGYDGCYWSSSLSSGYPTWAYFLYFNLDNHYRVSTYYREYGQSVRAVVR